MFRFSRCGWCSPSRRATRAGGSRRRHGLCHAGRKFPNRMPGGRLRQFDPGPAAAVFRRIRELPGRVQAVNAQEREVQAGRFIVMETLFHHQVLPHMEGSRVRAASRSSIRDVHSTRARYDADGAESSAARHFGAGRSVVFASCSWKSVGKRKTPGAESGTRRVPRRCRPCAG